MKNRNRCNRQNLRILWGKNTGDQSFLRSRCRFCFYIFALCLATSQIYARRNYYIEEFDPVGLLESRLEQHSQDVNTLNIPQSSPMVSEIQPALNKTLVNSDTTSSFFGRITQQAEVSADNISESWQSSFIVPDKAGSEPASSIQNDLIIAQNPTTESGRQLWQARISVPREANDTQSKSGLQQIIKQISSVKFKAQKLAPKPIVVVVPALSSDLNEIPSGAQTSQGHPRPKTESKLPYEPITEQTLQVFKDSSQHPEQLNSPFELAEVLFKSGCLSEAAKCYKEALNRMSANEPDRFADRPWLLFQIGNCLQKTDPQTAKQMYSQLITEYPGSPWADSAKAKSKLIYWYLNDKPLTLINAGKP